MAREKQSEMAAPAGRVGGGDGPEAWYRGLPPITRSYLTACSATTVLIQLELISPMLIYLDFGGVFSKLELWRLLTNFCFFGKFSMPFVFSMFFLVRYGKELEAKRFEGRAADYLWCMGFTGLLMTVVAWLLGDQPFLASSMLSMMVYLWSREFAEQTLSMFGLFNVQVHAGLSLCPPGRALAQTPPAPRRTRRPPPLQAFYFPWVLCAIHVLMGGSPIPDLIGIFGGHVYYFLEDVHGTSLKAPAALRDLLDPPATGAQRAAQQNRNAFGGHAWGGGGQRLGG